MRNWKNSASISLQRVAREHDIASPIIDEIIGDIEIVGKYISVLTWSELRPLTTDKLVTFIPKIYIYGLHNLEY